MILTSSGEEYDSSEPERAHPSASAGAKHKETNAGLG